MSDGVFIKRDCIALSTHEKRTARGIDFDRGFFEFCAAASRELRVDRICSHDECRRINAWHRHRSESKRVARRTIETRGERLNLRDLLGRAAHENRARCIEWLDGRRGELRAVARIEHLLREFAQLRRNGRRLRVRHDDLPRLTLDRTHAVDLVQQLRETCDRLRASDQDKFAARGVEFDAQTACSVGCGCLLFVEFARAGHRLLGVLTRNAHQANLTFDIRRAIKRFDDRAKTCDVGGIARDENRAAVGSGHE